MPGSAATLPGQLHRRLARQHAGPLHADVDLQERPHLQSRSLHRPADRLGLVDVVQADRADRPCGAARPGGSTFCGPAIRFATSKSAMPAAAKTSASPSLAQVRPMAPASIRRRAMSGDLWHLACGRQATPCLRHSAAASAMFASRASRSMHSAGVSSSSLRSAQRRKNRHRARNLPKLEIPGLRLPRGPRQAMAGYFWGL